MSYSLANTFVLNCVNVIAFFTIQYPFRLMSQRHSVIIKIIICVPCTLHTIVSLVPGLSGSFSCDTYEIKVTASGHVVSRLGCDKHDTWVPKFMHVGSWITCGKHETRVSISVQDGSIIDLETLESRVPLFLHVGCGLIVTHMSLR